MHNLIYAILLSFAVSLLLGPVVIPMLRRLKFGQMVRDDGPQTHLSKAGTPTMGGVIILLAIVLTCLVLFNGPVEYLLLAVLITLGYGLVGFLDDFIKVIRKRSMGLKAYQKIIGQLGLAIVVALYAYNDPGIGSKLIIPFTGGAEWDMGVWFIPFTVFVVISVVNGVNLTDGLDGLASGVTLLNTFTLGILYVLFMGTANAQGQTLLAGNYGNMLVFAGAVTGACLGFLRFNTYPARVFMGDTGALALGGAVAVLAIMLRVTLLIPVMGLMFVLSDLSVVLQVGSYKLRKKRVFRMAPLHHHYELKGNPETKVVSMYMLVTTVTCLIALLGV
ncbi:MAG: phospho-N-acetylmuramoyl-pentapeptide-transferase [Bacillota bacterium]